MNKGFFKAEKHKKMQRTWTNEQQELTVRHQIKKYFYIDFLSLSLCLDHFPFQSMSVGRALLPVLVISINFRKFSADDFFPRQFILYRLFKGLNSIRVQTTGFLFTISPRQIVLRKILKTPVGPY